MPSFGNVIVKGIGIGIDTLLPLDLLLKLHGYDFSRGNHSYYSATELPNSQFAFVTD